MAIRLFTPEEANALLPRLRPLLAALREAHHEHRFALEQALEIARFGSTDGDEARAWREKAEAEGARVEALVEEVRALGAEVKDPVFGLIDLYGRASDGRIVWLCYRDDEPALAHWHPLESGFASRRPLSEL